MKIPAQINFVQRLYTRACGAESSCECAGTGAYKAIIVVVILLASPTILTGVRVTFIDDFCRIMKVLHQQLTSCTNNTYGSRD